MDTLSCPACKAKNDADAAYCDQCGQPLTPPETGGQEGDCPACGGTVEDRGDGKGVCQRCGLELVETAEEPAVAADPSLPERLTAAILEKTQAGASLEQAVAEACAHLLKTSPPPEAAGENQACPLCGAENPAEAPQCGGCSLWFRPARSPRPCPRCGHVSARDGKCECGAILTLSKLLGYLEPSVRWICSRCKQPYTAPHPECPDCGGALLSAERLQAHGAHG